MNSMNDLPRVHILLLNFNGWRDTLECLESVLRLDYPDFRVIVCDNGSSDGSVERIRAWAEGSEPAPTSDVPSLARLVDPPIGKPVHYVSYTRAEAERGGRGNAADDDARLILVSVGENLGFTGGNNVGLRYLQSRGERGHVLVLNNDTVVEPSSLRLMVERLEANRQLAAVGATLFWY